MLAVHFPHLPLDDAGLPQAGPFGQQLTHLLLIPRGNCIEQQILHLLVGNLLLKETKLLFGQNGLMERMCDL